MNDMLTGAIGMASMVIALYFLRFWRSTNDRFFLFFALAFFIEGLNRIAMDQYLGLGPPVARLVGEYATYIFRLVAYSMILFAIWDKNRSGLKRKKPKP